MKRENSALSNNKPKNDTKLVKACVHTSKGFDQEYSAPDKTNEMQSTGVPDNRFIEKIVL